MLILTTIRRLALPLLLFLAWTPAAYAWSWPVQGPVVRAFSYDEAHPYTAGQHRGIDIAADAVGETVIAPAAGTVSFAGTVPTNGKSITIVTDDGYAVTLTHLGSFLVAKGATVAERDTIGTIGPSGTAEIEGPYVHLGVRHATDPNGYVDPLGLLPPAPTPSQPTSGSGSSTASGTAPSVSSSVQTAPASEPASTVTESRTPTHQKVRARGSSHAHERARGTRVESRPSRSPSRPEVHPAERASARTARPMAERGRADGTATSAPRRPVVEAAGFARPTTLDAGAEIRSTSPVAKPSPSEQPAHNVAVPLILNGTAALAALGAAFVATRGRRKRCRPLPAASAAHVFHLPRRDTVRRRSESRAA